MGLFRNLFGSQAQPADAHESGDEPGLWADAASHAAEKISHALVLPDRDFLDWYYAAEAYTQHFERVAVIRSPAGNDLNRYRNVTAVEAPSVWLKDSALEHIRRVYRSVVRVDLIKARSPAQLAQMLQQRIDRDDRYGEFLDDGHLHDRFVLGWPSDAMPARIVVPFDAELGGDQRNEGLTLFTPPGTIIRAPLTGTVALVMREPTALGYGQYVQIGTFFDGVHYLVTLTHLVDIRVQAGQSVQAGDVIAVSDQAYIKLVVQSPGRGLDGYVLPHVMNPTDLIYWQTLRLRPTVDGLRVRRHPGVGHEIMTQVNATDDLETLETHGRTLVKVGHDDEWINVRAPNGRTGYTAAWYLQAIAPELIDSTRLTGVNLDLMHALGRPAPPRLGKIDWVRFVYNVSYNPNNNTYGNTDLVKAYARYRPFIEQYAQAGYRVIVVFTHQTFGEGAGFDWNQMDGGQWNALCFHYVAMIREIARQYAGKGLVYAYQIWNEQDAPAGAASAVSMPPGDYAYLLSESIRAIRAVDSQVKIITGGHTGGPISGAEYAYATLRAMVPGILPDGIAVHPYGRGTADSPYAIFGHIDDEIESYRELLPGRPLWMTEWGVLDHPNDSPAEVAQYATEMVRHVRIRFPGAVTAMVWYAWAQSMHNGYGLVGADDRPRQPLYDDFLNV